LRFSATGYLPIMTFGKIDAAKDAATEWARTADTIEQSLTDALMNGGKSGADYTKAGTPLTATFASGTLTGSVFAPHCPSLDAR